MIFQYDRDNLWLQRDPIKNLIALIFSEGIIVFRPTDVVCPKSLNRLDPFLRDLAKSGEIFNDHKVDIDILSFLPNYPIYSLDSTKAFGALRDIVLL